MKALLKVIFMLSIITASFGEKEFILDFKQKLWLEICVPEIVEPTGNIEENSYNMFTIFQKFYTSFES